VAKAGGVTDAPDAQIPPPSATATDGARDLSDLPDPEALVFDLDGTLVDTVPTRIEGWMRTFDELGVAADRRHVATLIGADGKRLAQEVAAVAGRGLDADRAEAIDRRAGEIYGELNTDPRPLPGVGALLDALSGARLRWAIATSSRAEQVMKSVDALGLGQPPMIVDGSHVTHAKPAPDLLLLAADELDTSPRRCWYVGDATWDMLAARGANMVGIGIASGAAQPDALLAAGAWTVTTMAGLADELRRRGLIA
jgi:HAD superfamily hydrolase (TIGR01509 family)